MAPLPWMVRNIHHRTTTKDFTEEIDEARFVRQYNFLHLLNENVVSVFGSHEPFAQCCAPFFQRGDHGGINASLDREVGRSVTRKRSPP